MQCCFAQYGATVFRHGGNMIVANLSRLFRGTLQQANERSKLVREKPKVAFFLCVLAHDVLCIFRSELFHE
jgi:hypothetical protein